MQPEFGNGLGFHQHEAGAKKEEGQIVAVDRIGKADGLAHEEIAEKKNHPERDHVGDRIGALDHVEERPIVGRNGELRIGLREIVGDIGKADGRKGVRIRHRHGLRLS